MRILNNKISLDLTANFETEAYDVSHIVYYSVHISLTNTPNFAGDFYLQCTNDLNEVWVDIPSAAQSISSGDTAVMFNVQNTGYKYVRLGWVFGSGTTGTVSMIINQKGFQT